MIKKRNGITLTESLAAIAVASIGLFGVMAIIPLAALQTKRGLDIDEVVNIGNSAIEMTKLYQMTDPTTWRELDNAGNFQNVPYNSLPYLDSTHNEGFCYVIDPLVLHRVDNLDNGNFLRQFPFVADGSTLSITPGTNFEPGKRITIGSAVIPNFQVAQTIFQAADNLVLDEVTDTLKLPPQKYNMDIPGGTILRRASSREVSWSVMLNSDKYGSDIFRMYVMVFRDRDTFFDVDGDGFGEGEQSWEVQFNGSGAGGGEITVANPVGTRGLDDGIFVDDWMLLTDNLPTQATLLQNDANEDNDFVFPNWNRLSSTTPPVAASDASLYYQRPIQPFKWYRVARVGSEVNQRLSLNGPDFESGIQFEFVTIGAIKQYLAGTITYADLQASATYVDRQVYGTVFSGLKAVYEKTIRLENDSIWR